jgi:hypothetical protein
VTTLAIDRLHARYDGVDRASAERLDGILADVVREHLDAEMLAADLGGGRIRSAWAVCIAAITFEFAFRPGAPRHALASAWVQGIIEALARALTAAEVDDADPGVVVYRSEGDALVDVLRGVAVGDHQRGWAWRQAEVIPRGITRPSGTDIAVMLIAHPDLAPGVLRAASACAAVVLDPNGWIAVARAVARTVHAPGADRFDEWEGERPGRRRLDTLRLDGSRTTHALEGAHADLRGVARFVPHPAWVAADADDRRALAILALLATRPYRARDLAAVLEVAGTAGAGSRPSEAHARDGDQPTAVSSRALNARGEPAPDRGESAGEIEPPAPIQHAETSTQSDALISRWAGVWFLLRPIVELELVDRMAAGEADPRGALAAVVHGLTGVGTDDPAVALLCGWRDGEGTGNEVRQEDDVIDGYANLLRAWLADNADAGVPGGLDPEKLFRRMATMVLAPGTIEVSFSLDDVDLRVRRAGLDLDPGFVWWLGSVVRFRYV